MRRQAVPDWVQAVQAEQLQLSVPDSVWAVRAAFSDPHRTPHKTYSHRRYLRRTSNNSSYFSILSIISIVIVITGAVIFPVFPSVPRFKAAPRTSGVSRRGRSSLRIAVIRFGSACLCRALCISFRGFRCRSLGFLRRSRCFSGIAFNRFCRIRLCHVLRVCLR